MTPYLPFHPGGEKELMRVAGRDGTKLFCEDFVIFSRLGLKPRPQRSRMRGSMLTICLILAMWDSLFPNRPHEPINAFDRRRLTSGPLLPASIEWCNVALRGAQSIHIWYSSHNLAPTYCTGRMP